MTSPTTAAIVVVALAFGTALLLLFLAGYAAGHRRARREQVETQTQGLAQLWRYQRLLNDSAREIDGLMSGVSPITETSRDELIEAREAAYPFVDRLPDEARWVVEAPALPDLADPSIDLTDVAMAYLNMADTIRLSLERRASEMVDGKPVPSRPIADRRRRVA